MAVGADRARWDTASAVIAAIVNMHRDPTKGRPLAPADVHPYERAHRRARRGVPLTPTSLRDWKRVLPPSKPGRRKRSEAD